MRRRQHRPSKIIRIRSAPTVSSKKTNKVGIEMTHDGESLGTWIKIPRPVPGAELSKLERTGRTVLRVPLFAGRR